MCHTLEIFESADNIDSTSARNRRKPHGHKLTRNPTSKPKQQSTCSHFQLSTSTCGNRLSFGCVRTSKRRGGTFGFSYSRSPWGSTQKRTLGSPCGETPNSNVAKWCVLGMYLPSGCWLYTCEASAALNTWKQRALVNAKVTWKNLFLTMMTSFTLTQAEYFHLSVFPRPQSLQSPPVFYSDSQDSSPTAFLCKAFVIRQRKTGSKPGVI